MGLQKQIALVICLCQLHNFCIDVGLGTYMGSVHSSGAPGLNSVDQTLMINGGVLFGQRGDNNCSPDALLDQGHHFENVGGHHTKK